MKVYCVVVYQQTRNNYCACIPDFPGCVSLNWPGNLLRLDARE